MFPAVPCNLFLLGHAPTPPGQTSYLSHAFGKAGKEDVCMLAGTVPQRCWAESQDQAAHNYRLLPQRKWRRGHREEGPWNSQGVKAKVTERKVKDCSQGSSKTQAQIGSSSNNHDVGVPRPMSPSEEKLVTYFYIQVPCFIFSRLLRS